MTQINTSECSTDLTQLVDLNRYHILLIGVDRVSDKKKSAELSTAVNSQRTLVTLDQLSQTIEVMSSVVNRLRAHLNEQIAAAFEESETTHLTPTTAAPDVGFKVSSESSHGDSLVVELPTDSVQRRDPLATLH